MAKNKLNNITRVVLIVLILVLLIFLFQKYVNIDNLTESFIVLVEDKLIPENCPDKLFFDGKYYYLHNTKKAFKQGSNPLVFKNLRQCQDYINLNGCQDLSIETKRQLGNGDPVLSYQRICNKKVANNLYDIEKCVAYAETPEEIEKCSSQADTVHRNTDLEQCMTRVISQNNPNLIGDGTVEYIK
tara:strand:+ start:1037 stop:1594 length:558 start_codon:yes stop_codon:yes gene_type:complete